MILVFALNLTNIFGNPRECIYLLVYHHNIGVHKVMYGAWGSYFFSYLSTINQRQKTQINSHYHMLISNM